MEGGGAVGARAGAGASMREGDGWAGGGSGWRGGWVGVREGGTEREGGNGRLGGPIESEEDGGWGDRERGKGMKGDALG